MSEETVRRSPRVFRLIKMHHGACSNKKNTNVQGAGGTETVKGWCVDV